MTKVQMISKKSKDVAEDDVMFRFYDIDTVIHGEKARVQPTPSSNWVWFDCFDFLHWLVDISRLDYFDSETRRISSNGCPDSADSFWYGLAISKEAHKLLNEYLTADELAQTEAA